MVARITLRARLRGYCASGGSGGRLGKALVLLARSRRGMTALEFGLAGPAFLTLMVATAEIATTLYAQSALDNAARAAARQLQTNTAPKDAKGVQTVSICPFLSSFLQCDKVFVGVVPVADYTGDGGLDALIANGQMNPAAMPANNPGASSSLMLLRATYAAPAMLSQLMPSSTVKLNGTQVYPVVSSVAYRNEF